MSLARGAAVGALGAAVIVLAFVLLGGGGGSHQYHLLFQTAGQLVSGDEVQVGGRAAGSIDSIYLTKNNQAQVDITVDDDFAPLHAGTNATIRLTSLSGVANRYVQLDLGPNSNPVIPDGATIREDHTTSVVDIDQIFDTLDAPTREGLGRFIRGQGQWVQGKTKQANLSAYYFNPALTSSADVFNQLSTDQQTLSNAVVSGAAAMKTIASRAPDLTNAVTYANQFSGALASENQSLSAGLAKLPATLSRATSTFAVLRTTLDQVQGLVGESYKYDIGNPKTGLPALFTALRPAAANAVPVFSALANIIYRPGADNDLTDIFEQSPELQARANEGQYSSFPESIKSLEKGMDTVTFARPYTVDLVGWIRELGQATAFYDSNGHYARVTPAFNSYSYDSGSKALNLLDADQRLSVYDDPAFGTRPSDGKSRGIGNTRRCPGAAAAAPSGMTWPFLSGGASGCDPDQKLPGAP